MPSVGQQSRQLGVCLRAGATSLGRRHLDSSTPAEAGRPATAGAAAGLAWGDNEGIVAKVGPAFHHPGW